MNMKKIILLLALFAAGCKKSSSDAETYNVKFSPAGLEYVKLTPGKYLIYKDSASGSLDSVVVTTSSLGTKFWPAVPAGSIFSSSSPAYNGENFSLTLTKYVGTVAQEWFNGYAEASISYYPPYSSDSAGLLLAESLLVSGTSYHALYYGAFSYPGYYNSLNHHIPAMTIEGNTFTDIITGGTDNTNLDINNPNYLKRTFYWAKGIGIIKREIISTGGIVKTHVLLRHN
jgi:hypothetical protein